VRDLEFGYELAWVEVHQKKMETIVETLVNGNDIDFTSV
jgi:hypothetical protein